MVFRLFWILTRKTCVFAVKFLAGLSKTLSTCPVEHLQSKFFEWKSWKLGDFRKIFEAFGTRMEKLFQGWQNSNRCPREQFMKTFFQKRKIRSFFRFCAIVYFQQNFLPEFRKPQSMYPWEFLGKNTFWNIYIIFHTFFGLWSKKRLVGKKFFFPGCHNCNPRIQRHFLRKSSFFEKKFVCSSVLVFEQLILSTDKKLVRVSKKQPTNTEKSWRKKFVEKMFF